MMEAIFYEDFTEIELLLKRGRGRSEHITVAIIEASDKARMVGLLLDYVEPTEKHLQLAVNYRDRDIIKLIIKRVVPTKKILDSVVRTNAFMVMLFINNGAIFTEDHLHRAVIRYNLEMIKLIKVVPSSKSITYAIKSKRMNILKLFMEVAIPSIVHIKMAGPDILKLLLPNYKRAVKIIGDYVGDNVAELILEYRA